MTGIRMNMSSLDRPRKNENACLMIRHDIELRPLDKSARLKVRHFSSFSFSNEDGERERDSNVECAGVFCAVFCFFGAGFFSSANRRQTKASTLAIGASPFQKARFFIRVHFLHFPKLVLVLVFQYDPARK